jgi:iron complex outermembrane receptor protein
VVPAYENEDSTTYEVGAKGTVLPGVFVSGAVYLTYTSDALVSESNGCAVGAAPCFEAQTQFLRNSGKSRVYGGELELNSRFEVGQGDVRLSGGVSHQKSRFVSGPDEGLELARVPRWLLNGNLNFRHPLGANLEGFTNLKANSTFGGVQDVAAAPFELSDYTVVDVRAGGRWAGWELAGFVRNLFDVQPYVFKAVSTERYLAPQTYGVELSVRF